MCLLNVGLTSWSYVLNTVCCCACYAGECSREVNTSEADVTEHQHDDKPRPYVCTVCEKRFARKSRLKDHKLWHRRKKIFECRWCKKHFLNYHCLRTHMNIHTHKYKCFECGECFQGNRRLAEHKRRHSGEKPLECTVCSKRFTTSVELVKHSIIHSGEKPYKCHVCDKAFSPSRDVNSYIRIHTGDKPYKRSVCNSFSQSSNSVSVLIGGRCLRQTVKCNFMYVWHWFKASSHVDNVENVLCGRSNWREKTNHVEKYLVAVH